MKRPLLQGILFVLGGAISYGVLATMVKMAYSEGYTTAEITLAQYLLGMLFFGFLLAISTREKRSASVKASAPNVIKLLIGGSAFGVTGICYYYSVQYLPVSVCVILLIQSIWMGVVIESFLKRTIPAKSKVLASLVVIAGTVLATDVIADFANWKIEGIVWGLLAALFYTISMMTSTSIATNLRTVKRSFYMMTGAFIIVLLFGLPSLISKFNLSIFWTWGAVLALFGTILPPFLFNIGMPRTGVGLGSILISIEIPVSVGLAYIVLNEPTNYHQWLGILLIISAIVALNYGMLKAESVLIKS